MSDFKVLLLSSLKSSSLETYTPSYPWLYCKPTLLGLLKKILNYSLLPSHHLFLSFPFSHSFAPTMLFHWASVPVPFYFFLEKVKVFCPTLRPHGLCLPGSSVHGILQARILEWVAVPFSRGPSWFRDWTWVSRIAGRFITVWASFIPVFTSHHIWL